MNRDIVVSIKTVLFFFFMLFAIYIIYQISEILIILAVSTIIVISVEHAVNFFKKQKVMNKPLPRSASVLLVYFILITTILVIFTVGLPPVVVQAQKLVVSLVRIVQNIPGFEELDISVASVLPRLTNVGSDIFSTTFNFISSIAGIITVLIISIYMSLDWENIKSRLFSLFAGDLRKEVSATVDEIEISIGHWVKGQLLLMFVIGLMSFVGLAIIRIDNALALALVAGLLEIVPVLGPVIALVLAGIVGFSQSLAKGIAVVALFALIQQLENNLLVPKVMHKVSGFSPLVILLALLVGNTLLGIVGAIMAVPVMMILVIIVRRALRYSPPIN